MTPTTKVLSAYAMMDTTEHTADCFVTLSVPAAATALATQAPHRELVVAPVTRTTTGQAVRSTAPELNAAQDMGHVILPAIAYAMMAGLARNVTMAA